MAQCHCGNPADLMVRVLKEPDARSAEATYAVCYDHISVALEAMVAEREKVDGIIKIISAKQSPYTHAWFLINQCRWKLNTPEWAILMRLAKLHDEGTLWVLPEMIQHNHGGGSKANSRSLLTHPRLTDERYPLVQSCELTSKDGKSRTYYRLAGWEGP